MIYSGRLVFLALIAAVTSAASLSTSPAAPRGWSYQGCYVDGNGGRTLGDYTYTNSTGMTQESCIAFCVSKKSAYAGLEYSQECWCGSSIAQATSAPADCTMACAGNSTEACGAGNRLSVFWSGQNPPIVNPGTNGYSSIGCYTDAGGNRTLGTGVAVAGGASNMSISSCTTACKNSGFTFAGTEYAQECYCANSLGGAGVSATSGCNMVCSGNSSEYCGGSNRLNVYQFGALTSSSSSSTISPTTTSSIIASSSISAVISSSSVVSSSSVANISTASTASSATTVSSTASSTATALPSGFVYKGCWVDNAYGRILTIGAENFQNMTVERCVNDCITAGFAIAGIEYSTECYCGNQVIEAGAPAAESSCNMACGGNKNETCGGPSRMSLYSNNTITVLPVPVPQNTSLPGSWTYQGCATEGANGVRALPNQLILANTNSATQCLSQCSQFGYTYGGMEYGRECYCGDLSDLQNANSTMVADSQCNMACTGNGSYVCGAGSRLSLYKWTGAALYNWSYPTGNNAGSINYFIPGVVVPLITVPTRNGKITFVEKAGTSYFGNSTGAYELDPSLASNFSAAWREMGGITTDVFCSAGLVLPDAAGRVLTVGGWSLQSTFGVRLYSPNGQLGTNSTNSWQENHNEVALQTGRWYPSAMIMANGSILVVGGETGSNAGPSPSLEILPRAGGLVYADYLNQTDPNNLYPFLAVLPSGYIMITYYNQAALLDPVSLQPVRQLPTIPGAVNRPDAGRNYPLEGVSVILPQYAPYTDPLTYLICGGSTPGAAYGLDNCVSIQPDVPNSTWVLERMPSRRVMPNMIGLPDGTYLIINGAHFGVAGFGLGYDPNFNSVLYDPRKPIGSRFSVMANSTIARLYHSEAVLMDDGRVLVSGSDPQDPRYPEELRVEVWTPPYILNGAPRPSFGNISQTTLGWGASMTVPVTIPSGNLGAVQISLMGAIASTHGNSMGQRTYFPAISCSGSSCRITAPPNANVCPPGWFQMFVLDNGVPSTAKWIRIGGDPGNLGSWPNYSDFTLPGS